MNQSIVSLRSLTRSDLAAIAPWAHDDHRAARPARARFRARSPKPDHEGMLYYRVARPPGGDPE